VKELSQKFTYVFMCPEQVGCRLRSNSDDKLLCSSGRAGKARFAYLLISNSAEAYGFDRVRFTSETLDKPACLCDCIQSDILSNL
jgi:hypothetical protein